MKSLNKTNKKVYAILSLPPIIIFIICLFLPLYSLPDKMIGGTIYYYNAFTDPINDISPIGFIFLGTIIINIILVRIIVFTDKNILQEVFFINLCLWLFIGGLIAIYWMFPFFRGFYDLEFQISYNILTISWIIMAISFLYLGSIIYNVFGYD